MAGHKRAKLHEEGILITSHRVIQISEQLCPSEARGTEQEKKKREKKEGN